jgi:tetratricopeptide (TPR) repeat protein
MNKKDPSKTAIPVWQKIALVLLGLLFSLALLEAGFRLGGFVQLSLHEYGNLQSMKQKGAYRILCLGDSTTQMAYPRFLEQILNKRQIGVRFCVIDKGSGNTDARAILSQVDSYLAKYHHDLVVAMMGLNDKGSGLFQDLSMNDTGIFRHSLLYRFVKMRLIHFLEKIKSGNIHSASRSHLGREPLPERGKPVPEKANLLNATFAEKVARSDLRNAEGTQGPAVFHRNGGRISKTGRFQKKSPAFHPANDMAYVESGRLLKAQGKFSQAEDSYRKAIEINPLNASAYIGLGRLYQDYGKFSLAEDFFKKAIEIYPMSDRAYAGLGDLYVNYGILSQAEAAFKKALELNPADESNLIKLGGVYRDQGELTQAEDLFKKNLGIHLKRTSDRTLRAMASLYEEMGKPELAKKYAEMAYRMGSEDNAVVTVESYLRLKEILDPKGIKLVCMQYPLRNMDSLKRIFGKDKSIIFVDNEQVFKEAVKRSSFQEYFKDMFGGDFGHCTQKGNELLAQNIADVILREVFNKQ